MQFRPARLAAWLAAGAVLLTSSVVLGDDSKDPPGQATFISPDNDINFAFTVPNHDNRDTYFALRVPTDRSWGAVGLGSDDMPGALYLMVYKNDKGNNVTFSPRLAYGNYEPKHFPDMEYELLNGTGIFDGHMVVVAKCTQYCQSWPSGGTSRGYIDVSSEHQKAIYAVGPKSNYQSDRLDAPLAMHERYGVFEMNMKKTLGNADAPVLADGSQSENSTPDSERTGFYDVRATIHAVFMSLAVALLFPLGIGLKWGGYMRGHAITQSVAVLLVVVGFAFGVLVSFHYQRSKGFNSYHQIVGIIIIFAFFVQLALGFLHHTKYKKTQMPTRFGLVHRYLGAVAVAAGFANALAGFSFAENRFYAGVLFGLFILLIVGSFVLLWWRRYTARGVRRGGNPLVNNSQQYQAQPPPWRERPQESGIHDPPPGYEAPLHQDDSSHIGLQPVGSSPWRRDADPKDEDEPDLGGSAQRPREFT